MERCEWQREFTLFFYFYFLGIRPTSAVAVRADGHEVSRASSENKPMVGKWGQVRADRSLGKGAGICFPFSLEPTSASQHLQVSSSSRELAYVTRKPSRTCPGVREAQGRGSVEAGGAVGGADASHPKMS